MVRCFEISFILRYVPSFVMKTVLKNILKTKKLMFLVAKELEAICYFFWTSQAQLVYEVMEYLKSLSDTSNQLVSSVSPFLSCLALPSKRHLYNLISLLSLKPPHQVYLKSITKYPVINTFLVFLDTLNKPWNILCT